MANDLNQCTFTGRLGADPEVKSFANGGRIANLRIAVGARWKDKQGEKQERTEWISVTATQDGLIGVIERYLRKGSRILVQGEWRTRKWQDRFGNDRYSTECVIGPRGVLQMLDGPSDQRGERKQSYEAPAHDDLDDEVPF
jgi:single-strand DNA-binding protein